MENSSRVSNPHYVSLLAQNYHISDFRFSKNHKQEGIANSICLRTLVLP